MTAEVAVLNRAGVALAADSAVTVGGTGGKTYASVDKLFHLSLAAPVGAMIFGNADFVGIPWETIIKVYRDKLGSDTSGTVKEYADDFQEFLRTARKLFPQKHQDREVRLLIAGWFSDVRDFIKFRLDEEAQKKNVLTQAEVSRIASSAIGNVLDVIREQPEVPRLRRKRRAIWKRFKSTAQAGRRQIFGRLPMSATARRALLTIAHEGLQRAHFTMQDSGLVIAGFGDDEFMPTIYPFALEGMVLNEPRILPARMMSGGDMPEQITVDNQSMVIPFAQHEMVYAFMEGIDLELLNFMQGSTRQLFDGATEAITDLVGRAIGKKRAGRIKKQVQPALRKMMLEMFQQWTQQRVVYWAPVLNAVAALPKDELAAMAESLVTLTKFRRRVTTEHETVGGPIDVAVITKGDGFVWVKRKHYFDPALNPRVIARYTREG